MSVDEVIDVIPVRNRFMTATGPVNVVFGMARTRMPAHASIGIFGSHLEHMLFHFALRRLMMQMSVMQKVDMVPMLNRLVTASLSVYVRMIFVSMCHQDATC